MEAIPYDEMLQGITEWEQTRPNEEATYFGFMKKPTAVRLANFFRNHSYKAHIEDSYGGNGQIFDVVIYRKDS